MPFFMHFRALQSEKASCCWNGETTQSGEGNATQDSNELQIHGATETNQSLSVTIIIVVSSISCQNNNNNNLWVLFLAVGFHS